MDRFIGRTCGKRDMRKAYLKSNMDRFIEIDINFIYPFEPHLKSNMDRFIGFLDSLNHRAFDHLKSNMDRFIEQIHFRDREEKLI